jgi:hypothetical protein
MALPHHAEAIQKEGRITLAANTIQKRQFSSMRNTARTYIVPWTTLQDRLNSRQPRLGSRLKFRLLSEIEESVLISWIYSIEQHGFLLYIINVQQIVQILIDRYRSEPSKPIGKNWIYKFLI